MHITNLIDYREFKKNVRQKDSKIAPVGESLGLAWKKKGQNGAGRQQRQHESPIASRESGDAAQGNTVKLKADERLRTQTQPLLRRASVSVAAVKQ